MFNNHFSTIGTKVDQKIPSEAGSFKDYLNKKNKVGKLIIDSNSSFFLTPNLPGEIDTVDANKSTRPNGIPVFILKSFKLFFFSMAFYISKSLF